VIQEEERAHGTISAKTYLLFFKEGVKSYFATALIILFFLLVEVGTRYKCIFTLLILHNYIHRAALSVQIGGWLTGNNCTRYMYTLTFL